MPCMSASIVATQNFLAQSGNLGSTNIFTSSANGLYRVSIYVASTGTSGSQTVSLQARFSDGGTQTQTFGVYNVEGLFNAGGYDNVAPLVLYLPSGNSISINTSVGGTGFTYDIYTVVEQLA
jgi:hypothetical protein